ncbi:hypothetical protein DSL72_000428 [Monilinia vaccinii-corymbosi]|uniref:Transcription regulator Rua1 C-terminal domain-containing protein n=1 Tax=Monilinia vaccinii-corymbosi TaxID=61207 RepID=A0A8A3P2W7_9HELO|nr:hypothetical protein DSL72_000428 [Monilinia vaccinii-corymbosi]
MDSGEAQSYSRSSFQPQSGFTFNPNNKFRRDCPPQSSPSASTMNSNEIRMKQEHIGLGMWSTMTPPNSITRPRPATIHETGFSYCIPEQSNYSLPAWDSSTMPMQPMHSGLPQNYALHQDFYSPSSAEGHELHQNHAISVSGKAFSDFDFTDHWNTKPCDDGMEMQGLDTEMRMGQAYTTDEAVPILDLRSGPDQPWGSRRMSGSSFTLSTTGALSEIPSYEDFSATFSETPSFGSDYPPASSRNSLMSSTQLSPVASPRITPQNRPELVRTQSRGRASPSPRPSMRSAPYSMDSNRNKRWSTGSYGTAPSRRPSPFVYHQGHESFPPPHPPHISSQHSSPTITDLHLPLNMANLQTQQHPFLMANNTAYNQNSMLPASHSYHEPHQFDTPPPLLSHGLFRMLQSNADPHSLHTHYSDLSDPPDLYASLHEEQLAPPPEDMNTSDPDLIPHEQELRFDGDLYTPRWVRGHGNKREGWCGICKPGRWLVLKNSAFWYDKSFTHGISAATGQPFQEPQETRRMDGNPDVWEGMCGSCNEWVALVSSKKKGTTWFRHAYKCHTHPKIKDAPKRRRESSHSRGLGASNMAKSKAHDSITSNPHQFSPMTPSATPGSRQRKVALGSPLSSLDTMI